MHQVARGCVGFFLLKNVLRFDKYFLSILGAHRMGQACSSSHLSLTSSLVGGTNT